MGGLPDSPCSELCEDQHAELQDDPGHVCWLHRVYVVDGRVHGEVVDHLGAE